MTVGQASKANFKPLCRSRLAQALWGRRKLWILHRNQEISKSLDKDSWNWSFSFLIDLFTKQTLNNCVYCFYEAADTMPSHEFHRSFPIGRTIFVLTFRMRSVVSIRGGSNQSTMSKYYPVTTRLRNGTAWELLRVAQTGDERPFSLTAPRSVPQPGIEPEPHW